MKIKLLFSLACMLLVFGELQAQAITQTVNGTITDQHYHALSGASVKISNSNFNTGATTDEFGSFVFQEVPVGRYLLAVSFSGYVTLRQELLIISAHAETLNIQLSEKATVLEGVEVTTEKNAADQMPGLTSMTIEKTMRVPANFFDPVRMATTYPGIIAANDQGNSIIVKGISPNGLLWRLNGLDIVNPNHLANAGTLSDKPVTNGGGVNILSAQMLDRTDFYTAFFPSNYGNALSGVIDMNLRNGNKDRTEFTAQASLLGLDVSAEGPIVKNKNTNYLANYRYSTVGLLSNLGIDFGGEVINFQDFSFNLNTAGKNGSTLSVFGFGGISNNEFKEKDQAEWKEDKDRTNIDYDAKTFAVGMNYHVPLKRGSLSVAFCYSGTDQNRTMVASSSLILPLLTRQYYAYQRSLVSSNVKYQTKVGARTACEMGVITNYIHDDLLSYDELSPATYAKQIDGTSGGFLIQPYTNFNVSLSESIYVNAGIRYITYTYNTTHAIEPRFLFSYQPDPAKNINLSYSLISQTQQPAIYFGGANKNLGLNKAHHLAMTYRQVIKSALKLNTEIYFQHLFDVPVQTSPSGFSTINLLEGYVPANLVSAGTGDNYGVRATLEKSFYNAVYFMIGGSYYESLYEGSDNKTRDTRFSGKYTVNGTFGKEWSRNKKNRTTGIHLRALYLGGLRETPIDLIASQNSYETVYDDSRPFENKLRDYFRTDLRISFRKNKPRYTRTFSIDIQNVTSHKNEAYHYYDFTQAKIITKYQLGLIPVLVYRIDF